MNLKTLFILGSMSLLSNLPAHAALTTSIGDIADPNVIDFENYDGLITEGPETVAPGVHFTGTPNSILGAYIADLGSNGLWGAGALFAATDVTGTLSFTFIDGPTRGVGAILNSFNGGDIVISAFGEGQQLLESHTINVFTPDGFNEGGFFGITRLDADIRSISFSGTGLVADNVTFTTPVPEPETYAMLLAGLGLTGWMARRRRQS
ncbi:FxDxF family PEP-CTERM protein [Nitrosovibrio sp. Nv17]|jgi:hypothetical protein|uniref:FxDxF family PEP-CTERM protein n=1 Tax=Nitrosovibrio sp. Nv17 TaxID=1855339 RepID=UPI000908E5CC|nr:FxDxF family PEP-CTERM protein [Nitrosovibrio sp. Nv17]SFW39729.1 PEP-CTERM protein-sorting domain-containing protein [Nitrosovibrio sp. Nv17]